MCQGWKWRAILSRSAQASARIWFGKAVCALVAGGGYAELCTGPRGNCADGPEWYGYGTGSRYPLKPISPYGQMCLTAAGLRSGESILVHGGSSGIGSTTIQLAKAFGATVFTTAGSAQKCAFCEKLGADHVINYRDDEYTEVIREVTNGRGVDVVLDYGRRGLYQPEYICDGGGRQTRIHCVSGRPKGCGEHAACDVKTPDVDRQHPARAGVALQSADSTVTAAQSLATAGRWDRAACD